MFKVADVKVCEEFATLQGEGRYLGVPSYFVRTTGCNLRCAWKNTDGSVTYCDTPFSSWNPEKGYDVDANHILKKLKDLPQFKHVVITGGEPTLQPDLADIVFELHDNGYKVTVETNGTKFRHMPAFMSISPKLQTSYAQEAGSTAAQLHSMGNKNWVEETTKYVKSNDYQLKFVYNNRSDLSEIVASLLLLDVPPDRVYLMPQGITTAQFKEKTQEMFKICVEHGFNYSPRMHIDIFGNKRGI